MPISKKRREEVAAGAVAWAQRVNASSERAKDKDLARILADKNADSAEYIARIVVSDMAREIARAVARAHRTGEISKKWANPTETDKLSAIGLGKFDKRKLFQAFFRKAQAAGEFEYAQRNARIEFIEYRTQRDDRVRPSHAKRDGIIRPKGDPWLRANTPPLDPNCRCFLRAVTKAEITKRRKAGETLPTPLPTLRMVKHTNKATGEVETLPEGIAPGFQQDPAADSAADNYRMLLEKRITRMLKEAEKQDSEPPPKQPPKAAKPAPRRA